MSSVNTFKINYWNVKRFLSIIILIQGVFISTLLINTYIIKIEFLRALVSFVYLTFVPGIVVMRIIRLRNISFLESFLYAVGISISFLMVLGVLINFLYPILGVHNPLSFNYLIYTLSSAILVMCAVLFVSDKKFKSETKSTEISNKEVAFPLREYLSPKYLFLYILLFIAILGTYVLSSYHNNYLEILLIVLIAISFLIIAWSETIPSKFYVAAIFVFSLSLLYHTTLITPYVMGSDIHIELFLANQVIWNSLWNSNIAMIYNSMTSVVMLAPIYSIITGLDLDYVFKIIYPLIVSLIPVGLFIVFEKQTNDKIAFLSTFLFISTSVFYVMLMQAARQQIAELYLVLLILLLTTSKVDVKRTFLLIVFGFSMAISHYGLNYLLLIIFLVFVFYSILKSRFRKKIGNFPGKDNFLSLTLVTLFFVFSFSWYLYTASSTNFEAFFNNFLLNMINGISDVFNPSVSEGTFIIVSALPFTGTATKYLYFISQIFIFIGVVLLIFKDSIINKFKIRFGDYIHFKWDYLTLSFIFLLILVAAIGVPDTSSLMSTYRTYHIALFFLAPFFVVGVLLSFELIKSLLNLDVFRGINYKRLLNLVTVFLVVYFLFNSGFVNEVINEKPSESTSFDLNLLHPQKLNETEYYSAIWFHNYCNMNSYVYTDNYGRFIILHGITNYDNEKPFSNQTRKVNSNSYIYLSNLNVVQNKIEILQWQQTGGLEWIYPGFNNSTFFQTVIGKQNKVYDSNGAQILFTG